MEQAQPPQQILKVDVLENYYIDSKFQFYVISPAIVDEGDYPIHTTEEDGRDPNAAPKPKKKGEKSKQTILLIAIKNQMVYSYVRESKLGKILGLSAKYKPRAISKHGLFIFAVEKKMKSYVVYEMTSGSLSKMISRPFIEDKQNAIPYVSEDGNFVILFDKLRKENNF